MLWILLSLFFCWLIYREFRRCRVAPLGYDHPDPTPLSKPYLAILTVLSLLFAWPPFHYWQFERLLSAKATLLADKRPAKVHCNTIFDTFFDSNTLAAGHADPNTGQIGIQYPWCERLMDYLAHPSRASREEIASLNLFTHESMHVRGELDEALTECQAVQRNFRAARLLGVPEQTARKTALDYYHGDYLRRSTSGAMSAAYFSDQCAPGKAMDEHLGDSSWTSMTREGTYQNESDRNSPQR
ncbi:MAG: hypothetical protein WCK63_15930 [Betaproteobacteria bacterium]